MCPDGKMTLGEIGGQQGSTDVTHFFQHFYFGSVRERLSCHEKMNLI